MFQDYLVEGNTCRICGMGLVRVPQSDYELPEVAPDDAIVCVEWIVPEANSSTECAERQADSRQGATPLLIFFTFLLRSK